jgi:hypothetical protein
MEEGLITLREAEGGETLLEQWSGDYHLQNDDYYEGTPIRIFEDGDAYVVITQLEGQPTFYSYVSTDDSGSVLDAADNCLFVRNRDVLDVVIARRQVEGAPIHVPYDPARCDAGGSSECEAGDIRPLRDILAGNATALADACDG